MAEIGATLREARMRAGIDIADVESRTKIRAKYLRALENEEWNLLPGTTFVKSFLRTYAESLGLDAKLLVEEYKFRHEPYDSTPGGTGGVISGKRRRGYQGPFGKRRPFGIFIVAMLMVVLLALVAVSIISRNTDVPPATTATTSTSTAATSTTQSTPTATSKPNFTLIKADSFKLRIQIPRKSKAAKVCVIGASGGRVVNGRTLNPGRSTSTLKSRAFLISVEDRTAKVFINGKATKLSSGAGGVIAYELTSKQQKQLPQAERPVCAGQ